MYDGFNFKNAIAMSTASCCTCARILEQIVPAYDEKAPQAHRKLECCGRTICADCLTSNRRFHEYCPYCQISSAPSSIPANGLREPPAYTIAPASHLSDAPPAYAETTNATIEKEGGVIEDVLHFVDPNKDSMSSLSLAYDVPAEVLRRKNHLYDDKLLTARKTILIPGEFCNDGTSLSPTPVESEEESIRKSKIRRWMITTKNADYDMALLYLKQTHYDLELAVTGYLEDEKWESEHPLADKSENKARLRFRTNRLRM